MCQLRIHRTRDHQGLGEGGGRRLRLNSTQKDEARRADQVGWRKQMDAYAKHAPCKSGSGRQSKAASADHATSVTTARRGGTSTAPMEAPAAPPRGRLVCPAVSEELEFRGTSLGKSSS